MSAFDPPTQQKVSFIRIWVATVALPSVWFWLSPSAWLLSVCW